MAYQFGGTVVNLVTSAGTSNITLGDGLSISAGGITIEALGNITTGSGGIQANGSDPRTNSVNIISLGTTSLAPNMNVSSTGNVNIGSSMGGEVTLGQDGAASGASVTANGNININSQTGIEIGTDTTLSTNSPFSNLGAITLTVGFGGALLNPIVTGDVPNATVTGTNPVLATANRFTANGTGVTLNGQGATITLNNQLTNIAAITFDGDNTVTADPPVGAPMAPRWMVQAATPNFGTVAAISGSGGTADYNAGKLTAQPIVGNSGQSLATISRLDSANNVDTSASSIAVVNGSGNGGIASTSVHNDSPASPMINDGSGIGVSALQASSPVVNGSSGVYALPVSSPMQVAMQSISSNQSISQATVVAATKTFTGGVSLKEKIGHADRHAILHDELVKGATLVAPDRLTVISTPFGNVSVGDRSVALIVANEAGLHVYNLDDCRRDSVVLHVNGESITVRPGAHVTITNNSVQTFEQVNPAQYVAYRNVRSRGLNGNLQAFHSEFSHISAIAGLEPLQNIMRFTDPGMRKISQHILKTTALLNMMNQSPMPYEYMVPPSMTAMNQ